MVLLCTVTVLSCDSGPTCTGTVLSHDSGPTVYGHGAEY